jgi:hypothetical protein
VLRLSNFLSDPANAREHESTVILKVDALMNNSVLADPRTSKSAAHLSESLRCR